MSDCLLRLVTFEKATQAVGALRALLLRPDTHRAEILEKFWMLNDVVLQLADAVSDCPQEAAELIANQYIPFIRHLVDVLNFTRVSRFAMIPAVNQACDQINSHLCEIKRLTDTAKVAGAL